MEFENSFPIRRIEIDSNEHRMLITKNIWLSGVFLNGYFKGVWNYGLFRGYPLITEMFDSQWIDGKFDGGHFYSTKSGADEGLTFSSYISKYNTISNIGLSFSAPHKLALGDKATPKFGYATSSLSNEINIIAVTSEYEVTIDMLWSTTLPQTGVLYTNISSGLIQNVSFNSNNVSKSTSLDSFFSNSVFIYNSWMDINYLDNSAVNIGKPQTILDKISRKTYSENNLYGYPTGDILSSDSIFRDSFSLNSKTYKLGSKYKVFEDYIGDSSKFEDYFEPNSQEFLDKGWAFSESAVDSLTFSRTTTAYEDSIISGKELQVDTYNNGGVLDIAYVDETIVNRSSNTLDKSRYTIIEFDLFTYSVTSTTYSGALGDEPIIHFNNLNVVSRLGSTFSSTFLPVYKNINHLTTNKTRKYEYFFNKKDLSVYFRGNGVNGVNKSKFILDNLKFYEIDMVPFFQYFTYNNINISVQVPYQGIAPFIDYNDSNFSFIDSITFGFDSTEITNSYNIISGVGTGISQ